MKLPSITTPYKLKDAFLKDGTCSLEDYEKNSGLSVEDVLLDPNNLYPLKMEDGIYLRQMAVIPAKEALFFIASVIENGQDTEKVFPFALNFDENDKAVISFIDPNKVKENPNDEIYQGLLHAYRGLLSGKIKNNPKYLYSKSYNKGKKIAFGFMTVFYALLAVLGVVGALIMPDYMQYFALATCLAPMWLTYYRFHDPFNKDLGKGLFVLSIVLSVGLTIGYYLMVQDTLLTLILIAFYVFQIIGYAKICEDKSSVIYVLVGIGSIIAVPVVIVLLIIGFILVIVKFIGSFFGDTEFGKAFKRGYNGQSEPETEYEYTVYRNGFERKLKRTSGTYWHPDRFIDDTGRYWYTEDNGETFIEESEY